jgi:hypothetical protein
MGLHAIIVDESVIDVEQEDNGGRPGHRTSACLGKRSLA